MTHYLDAAVKAACAAGEMLRHNFEKPMQVNQSTKHDIKLEIDVRAQELIAQSLLKEFPQHALYGEEGIVGDQASEFQWVVDPLDGTVNYYYGIPHFCVSIALRCQAEIIVGVIFDPIRNELWTAQKGATPKLNDREFRVSERADLAEAIVSVGLSKTGITIEAGIPLLQTMVHRARKCRLLGSAALDMAYVACGRFDAYIEQGISLWDVAAGWILVETAGGSVEMKPRTRHARSLQHHRIQRRGRFETVSAFRCGIGYDAHRLVSGRKLILGGVKIPHPRGLEGHSDADVLSHAVADAILGALGAGDIGKHFPNTEESIRGISSIEILRHAATIAAQKNARVVNVDATVLAEAPKISPHIAAMQEKIADALGVKANAISIKATTNEGLGAIGRSEGMAAIAVASVEVT